MTDLPPLETEPRSAEAPGPSDAELITAVRSGDKAAFGPLYLRHVGAARALARQMTRDPNEAEDLVSEAFAKVLSVVQGGGGPDVAFRAYLLTALRRNAYDRTRAGSRVTISDDLTPYDPGVPFVDPALEGLEKSHRRPCVHLAARAVAGRAVAHRGRGADARPGRAHPRAHRQRRRGARVPGPGRAAAGLPPAAPGRIRSTRAAVPRGQARRLRPRRAVQARDRAGRGAPGHLCPVSWAGPRAHRRGQRDAGRHRASDTGPGRRRLPQLGCAPRYRQRRCRRRRAGRVRGDRRRGYRRGQWDRSRSGRGCCRDWRRCGRGRRDRRGCRSGGRDSSSRWRHRGSCGGCGRGRRGRRGRADGRGSGRCTAGRRLGRSSRGRCSRRRSSRGRSSRSWGGQRGRGLRCARRGWCGSCRRRGCRGDRERRRCRRRGRRWPVRTGRRCLGRCRRGCCRTGRCRDRRGRGHRRRRRWERCDRLRSGRAWPGAPGHHVVVRLEHGWARFDDEQPAPDSRPDRVSAGDDGHTHVGADSYGAAVLDADPDADADADRQPQPDGVAVDRPPRRHPRRLPRRC